MVVLIIFIWTNYCNVGFEQLSPDDPSFGKPFAWPYPSDTANPGERVSPLYHSGDHNDSPRAQDT